MKICKLCNMRTVVSILCILWSTLTLAQNPEAMDKIESARIALITERLELTPEQAEKFWPLYREYTERRQELRKQFLDARHQIKKDHEISDEESKKLIDKGLELKEKQLALDRDYADKFNRVITARQLLQLRKAEDDFRQMLLERLEKRRETRDRLDRREERKNNE
jgi:membrane-associated HD superfamily phosphohydrolase